MTTMTGLAIAGAAVLVVLAVWWGYNRLVTLRNRVDAAWADLDVHLERRRALIPNLVSVVGAYAQHERDLLESVAAARASGDHAHGAAEASQAEGAVDDALGRVVALAEAYPQLKADESFRQLHIELVATENKIAFSRQLYNDTVTQLRNRLESFPGNLYARRVGFSIPELFAAEVGARASTRVVLE